MKKVLEMDSCFECPHWLRMADPYGHTISHECYLTNEELNDFPNFPEDCPLPDKEE